MKAVLEFRSDKPNKSGHYLTANWGGSETPYHMCICYYNADTGRWNDYDGTGESSFEVDMWADIRDMRKEKNDD